MVDDDDAGGEGDEEKGSGAVGAAVVQVENGAEEDALGGDD